MSYTGPAPHRWGSRLTEWRLWLAVPAVLLLMAVPTTLTASTSGLDPTGASAQATNPYVCPFKTNEDASARNVNLANPIFALATGDSIAATYEFEVVNSTLSPLHLVLTVPSFFAKFPKSTGGSVSIYLPPRTITLTGTSTWTNSTLATKSIVLTAQTNFSKSSATMSTQFIAIMGNAAYQTVTLAFRWDYSVTFASNGTKSTSPWSVVSITGKTPTTFYPAPFVQLVSTSNTTVEIGATFSTYLSGAISDTLFHSVLEYAATGNVMRDPSTDTPVGNSTPDLVAVTVLPATGPLSPSALLDHVRNVCSALLFSISVTAVYAPSATVTVKAEPSTCGPVNFDGTAYASGSKPVVVPSATALALVAGACSGHSFLGWNATAGASITAGKSASTTVTISATGSVTARYG
jgi:hypothetical protein